MPPNELHAKEFAEMIKKIFSASYSKELLGKVAQVAESEGKLAVAKKARETQKNMSSRLNQIEVEILDKKQIEENKMGLLLAVNAGSHHEPRVVILRYKGIKK